MNASTPVTVALADDHKMVRKGLISFLDSLRGVRVIAEAANGRELIRFLESAPALPEVCIIDINMPVMDGFQTVQLVREQWPQIGILVLTAFFDDLYIRKVTELGADACLSKDCDPEQIRDTLLTLRKVRQYTAGPKGLPPGRTGHADCSFFSRNELALLRYGCSDKTYKEIASLMKLTPKSVDGLRNNLFRKLNVSSRVGLALYAVRTGLVDVRRDAAQQAQGQERLSQYSMLTLTIA